MKNPQTPLITLLAGALVSVGISVASAQDRSSRPVIVTPPAVNNGSNWSRAPLPAARQFDDVKRPDGQAIDNLPPADPATNETPPPPPRVAILQSTRPAGAAEPGLMPTGRSAVAVSTSIDAATMAPTIRSAAFASRDQTLRDIEARMSTAEHAMSSLRGTASQMSAEGRQAFNAAQDDVKQKAKALKASLRNAHRAKEQDWENARAQLAADYEAYAAALARIDAAAGLSPTGR